METKPVPTGGPFPDVAVTACFSLRVFARLTCLTCYGHQSSPVPNQTQESKPINPDLSDELAVAAPRL